VSRKNSDRIRPSRLEERRASRRYKLALQIEIRLESDLEEFEPILGSTRDISTYGFYFAIEKALSVGMKIGFWIMPPWEEGTHRELRGVHQRLADLEADTERVGQRAREKIQKVLNRSLAIREVDAGSCNGCELEIVALNNPVYDLERFGIQFVASPRHADMLLVTGPVTRNMELALVKTYQAMSEPRLVVAVGACGISGGIFGKNYASLGGVDNVVPVDVYIPGCPPRPQALLHGILLAVGRLGERSHGDGRCAAANRDFAKK
jgi:Ni,Fe-hydrogenase III small subunit